MYYHPVNNKLPYEILSIAALVIAGVMTSGCADQLNDPQQPQDGGKTVTLTTTVGFDASTKALTAGGVKTFAAGETIAVFYTNESSNLVKATYTFTADDLIDGGRRAKITVDATHPKAGGAMKYIYPASMANDDGTVNYAALATQDGTLTSLANNFDLAVYDGTLTGDAALPSGVTLSNQLCILELVLKSKQGSAVTENITGLTISDGSNTYTITPSSLEKIYVAMRPVTSTQTLTFTASGYGTSLTKEVTGQTLEKNNLYPVNLTLTHLIDLSAVNVSELPEDFLGNKCYTAQDGDVLTGTQQGDYQILTANTGKNAPAITVTLAGVDINNIYPTQSHAHGINCRGNINLVLAEGSVNFVKGCAEDSFAGVLIRSERMLTISGSGSLTAIGYGGGAGIGGYGQEKGGNIKITGGTIIAKGGEIAAGIGSCSDSGSLIICGDIIISGGRVSATGGMFAAGIGGGYAYGRTNQCGNITISGGTVSATGGLLAAGIGGGYAQGSDAVARCGNITITSDVVRVTATSGGESSYSVGKGYCNGGGMQLCGTITIGGTVYWDGSSYQNDGATYLATSPLVYEPAP